MTFIESLAMSGIQITPGDSTSPRTLESGDEDLAIDSLKEQTPSFASAYQQAQDAAEGAVIYMQRCATCHGAGGQGDGPMAPALVVQPVDLTALAARNGGTFPVVRVVKRIASVLSDLASTDV